MPQKIKCETKAIIPEQWDVEAIIRAVPEALKQSTREMLADFNSTAATWDHKPAFSVVSTKDSAEVSTTDENWIRIDRGVPAKGPILARRRASGRRFFRIEKRKAKTRPGVLKARPGGKTGEIVYRASYKHKGIAARNFTGMIRDKYAKRYPELATVATDRGVRLGISAKSKEVKVRAR